jgi:hypothetical protein
VKKAVQYEKEECGEDEYARNFDCGRIKSTEATFNGGRKQVTLFKGSWEEHGLGSMCIIHSWIGVFLLSG